MKLILLNAVLLVRGGHRYRCSVPVRRGSSRAAWITLLLTVSMAAFEILLFLRRPSISSHPAQHTRLFVFPAGPRGSTDDVELWSKSFQKNR